MATEAKVGVANRLRLTGKSNSCTNIYVNCDTEQNTVKRKSDPQQRTRTLKHEEETSKKRMSEGELESADMIFKLKKRTSLQKSPLANSVFVLLLLYVLSCSAVDSPQFSICHNEHSFSRRNLHDYINEKRQTKDTIGLLFEWCSESALCADAYYITTAKTQKDEKAFRYIAKHWLQMRQDNVDLMRPFNETVCENESFEELFKTLWVVAMRLHIKETIRIECGANEQVVFDTETMEMHCICISDRNCVDASVWRGSSLNWSNTTSIIAGIVVIIVASQVLVLSISRRRTYHRLLLECQQKCGAREQFNKQL